MLHKGFPLNKENYIFLKFNPVHQETFTKEPFYIIRNFYLKNHVKKLKPQTDIRRLRTVV